MKLRIIELKKRLKENEPVYVDEINEKYPFLEYSAKLIRSAGYGCLHANGVLVPKHVHKKIQRLFAQMKLG